MFAIRHGLVRWNVIAPMFWLAFACAAQTQAHAQVTAVLGDGGPEVSTRPMGVKRVPTAGGVAPSYPLIRQLLERAKAKLDSASAAGAAPFIISQDIEQELADLIEEFSYFEEDMHRATGATASEWSRLWAAGESLAEGVSAFAEHVREATRTKMQTALEYVPNMILDEIGYGAPTDFLREGTRAVIGDILSMSDEPPSRPSIGNWLRSRSVDELSERTLTYLRRSVEESYGTPNPDELARADQALTRAAHPVNISRGVRQYVNEVIERGSHLLGIAADRILTPVP